MGKLPKGARGIEFETDIEPQPGGGNVAKWYYPNTKEVETNDDGYAVITVKVRRNTQSA